MRNVPKRINSVKTSYVLIYTTSLLLPKYGRLPPCNTVVLIENIAHFLLSDNIIFDFLSKGPASFSRLRESKRHAGVKGTPASAKLLIQLVLGGIESSVRLYKHDKDAKNFLLKVSDNKLAMPFLGLWLGVEHLQDIKIANSIKEFNNYNGYKVIITGENDHYTEYIREKHLNINKKNLRYDIVQGANHTFSSLQYNNNLIDLTIRHIKNIMDNRK